MNFFCCLLSFIQNISCSDMASNTVSVVHSPVEFIAGRERLFSVTLLACGASPWKVRGLYECSLNRSRGDPFLVWSASILFDGIKTVVSLNSTMPSSSISENLPRTMTGSGSHKGK